MLTYQTNFLLAREGHNIAPITPFWSLSVEEHFYMAWPMIALFTSRRVMWASAAIMAVGSVASRAYLASHAAPYTTVTMPTYSALDGIAIGCMLALLYRNTTQEEREPWIKRALLYGGALLVMRMGLQKLGGYNPVVNTLHTLPFALVAVWVIDRGARNMLPRLFSVPWLARIGVMTYAGYAVHRYVMHFLGYDYERGLHVFVPVLLITVLIAQISWTFFESPINNLKRFWPYVPRPLPTPAPASVPAGALPGSATELAASDSARQ
jgi:peptidoglycan/LPS O-acetylase OafA/YrhL